MAIESVFVANLDWFPVIESHLKTIYGNTVRFASYPSSIKPAYNTEDILKFPRGKVISTQSVVDYNNLARTSALKVCTAINKTI